MERQEARIRAERLDTSQHGKEETRLTRIRDINERTATRAGDLGYVMGGVQVMMDRRTQDEKTPKGGDHGEEDPGGMGRKRHAGKKIEDSTSPSEEKYVIRDVNYDICLSTTPLKKLLGLVQWRIK